VDSSSTRNNTGRVESATVLKKTQNLRLPDNGGDQKPNLGGGAGRKKTRVNGMDSQGTRALRQMSPKTKQGKKKKKKQKKHKRKKKTTTPREKPI